MAGFFSQRETIGTVSVELVSVSLPCVVFNAVIHTSLTEYADDRNEEHKLEFNGRKVRFNQELSLSTFLNLEDKWQKNKFRQTKWCC